MEHISAVVRRVLKNFAELHREMQQMLLARVFELREPKPGFRHQNEERIVRHRFPVRGGLTVLEVMERHLFSRNPLFDALPKGKKDEPS